MLTAGLCLGATSASDSPKEEAMELARKARRAEKAGHNAEAYLLYSEASALQRRNAKYETKMVALQARAVAEAKPAQAPAADVTGHSEKALAEQDLPDQALPAEDAFDSVTAREVAGSRPLRGPAELNAKPGAQDFNLTGTARTLFNKVAQSFGLEATYDGDYPAAGNTIRFQVTGADYRTALHDLEAATGSFVIPLAPHLFMVAQDTPQKRNDLEQVTDISKIAWDSVDGTLVLRDRVSRVLPAQALLQELFSMRPEIMIDVEFLEVSDSDIASYGFNVTNSFQAVFLGQILNNVVSFPAGATSLLSFGGGKTLIGLTVAQAQAMFNETISSQHTLLRTQLRASQGQAATFHSGDKFPVITAQYAGSVPTAQQGQVYAPPVSFTYEDLGFTLKITPHIHGMGEVTLTVDSSFEVLTGQSVNNLPIIGRRQLTSDVRLRDGEWAVVGGLMNPSEARSVSGFWGLAKIPLLGNLFKQVSTDKENENLLIAIRPRLLSLAPDQVLTPRLRVGSEAKPFSPL
jgi:general secretion pathway protein D